MDKEPQLQIEGVPIENFNSEEKELFFDNSEEGRIARDLCHTIARYYQSELSKLTSSSEEKGK